MGDTEKRNTAGERKKRDRDSEAKSHLGEPRRTPAVKDVLSEHRIKKPSPNFTKAMHKQVSVKVERTLNHFR